MPTITEETVSRIPVGEVKVERNAGGFSLFLKAPAWASIMANQPLISSRANLFGNTSTQYALRSRPDGISGTFRDSYGILYDGKINLIGLLADGIADGITFQINGVYNSETLRKVAQTYKEFLASAFNDYSRPVKIEYRITSGD